MERRRLMLVDDHVDILEALRRLLSNRYEIEAHVSGREALEAIRRRPPDVLVSDIAMGGLDGLALVRALRAEPATSALPVLLFSGSHDPDLRAACLAAGADDLLEKPFRIGELLRRIDALLLPALAAPRAG